MLREFAVMLDLCRSAVCAVSQSPLTHPPAAGALSREGRGLTRGVSLPSPLAGEGGAKRRVRGLARGKAVIIRVLTISAFTTLTACSTEQPNASLSSTTINCETALSPDSDWRPGCATRRNLAALAENPRDLERPRQEAPRDAMRRDGVISQYGQSRGMAPAAPASASATANTAKARP
jgi:hypothetical protein